MYSKQIRVVLSAPNYTELLTKPTPPPEENVSIRKDQFQFIFLMVLNDKKCKEKSRQDLAGLRLLSAAWVACLDIIYCGHVNN